VVILATTPEIYDRWLRLAPGDNRVAEGIFLRGGAWAAF
jgi:hypothetical protein